MINQKYNTLFIIYQTVKKYTRKLLEFLSCTPYKLMRFMRLQLYITLCSWPILIAWGLPLSLASPIGNFIFAPFLSGFLFLSSIIFFTELCYIPNGIFIDLLNLLTYYWMVIVSWADRSWLLACAQPPAIILIALPVLATALLHHKKLIGLKRNLMALIALCFLFFIALQWKRTHEGISYIPCGESEMVLITHKQKTALIDPGALRKRKSSSSWIQYTLLPHLYKSGTSSLDYLICLTVNAQTLKAMGELCRIMPIKHIYIPAYRGEMGANGTRGWQQMVELAKKYGTRITHIEENQEWPLKEMPGIIISDTLTHKNSLKYAGVHAEFTLNNEHISIIPEKHTGFKTIDKLDDNEV